MSDSVSGKKQSSLQTGATGIRQESLQEKQDRGSDTSRYRSPAEESVRFKLPEESSVYKGSEEDFENTCDLCKTGGDHVEAQGFCTDCKEYLCSACLRSHSRSKASRNHTLLDKKNITKKYKHCDPCKVAGYEEESVGYCADCVEYLCSSCFMSHCRSKASRRHVLIDNMPVCTEDSPAYSVANMNISKTDEDAQRYNEEFTFIRDCYVKAKEDKAECFIISMTLVSRTELILADLYNKSLKLFDLKNNVIKDSLRLKSNPLGLTTISKYQAAVALGGKCQIKIISASRGLSVLRTLNITGACINVKYINGKLYVSFHKPVKFQILDLKGRIYKTINPDSDVLKYCTLPRYFAVSPDESMIYISDWKSKKVTCSDINGRLISVYIWKQGSPQDITITPFGSVYVCNKINHFVQKLASAGSEAPVLLSEMHGLFGPQAISFNADMQHLYISSKSLDGTFRNCIKIYKW